MKTNIELLDVYRRSFQNDHTITEGSTGYSPQQLCSARFHRIVESGTALGADQGWSARIGEGEYPLEPVHSIRVEQDSHPVTASASTE